MTQATLPARPNLLYLKKLAKERLRKLRASDGAAKLAEAQLAIAREHGYASWRKLKEHVERVAAAQPAAAAPPAAMQTPAEALAQPGKAEWKPIMDSAFRGNVEALRRALAGGADPNVVSRTGHRYRPLHRAIEFKKTFKRGAGHEQVVRVLLEAGADPKLRGTFGQVTALQLAAMQSPQFVPILLERFGPLDMFHACAVADERRVAALLKQDRSLATARDLNHMQPLHYCCGSAIYQLAAAQQNAQVRIAQMLIEAGADPMSTYTWDDAWQIPALYHCCGQHDNPAVADVLFKAGATPFDNETVYHASDEGHEQCLALIERYAERKKLAEECSKCLASHLHWGHSRSVPWLLGHGANPNRLNKWGDAALHSAVKRRLNSRIIGLLLAHRADPMLKNAEGKTAIQLARSLKHKRIGEQLQNHVSTRKAK